MDVAWIVLGALLLLITFLDTFLAVLNYDEGGILVNRLIRWQWIVLRAFTRRVSRRWRPLVLRQVTGVLLLTTILSWIGGIVLGFTLIYLGLIGLGAFQLSKGVDADFLGALYLSFGQFSTVGADNISPGGGWVNLVPVLEALTSVVMLSFIITFLGNVFAVIQLLRSLCADFFSVGAGVGSPIEALQPYFPDGTPRDLDRHLEELAGDFNLYCDGLRQDHAAYHFQSGDDQFSLPFAVYMTSGVVSALRWGLPTGHEATRSPSLPRLIEAFDDFRDRRYRMMRWNAPAPPQPASRDDFSAAFATFSSGGPQATIDPWVLQFLVLNADMAAMIASGAPTDAADAYARYLGWLPFAFRAQAFVAAVSLDLDYQPVYRGAAPIPGAAPITAPVADTAPTHSLTRRFTGWIRRRHLFIDPGYLRLSDALRTLASVIVAIAIVIPVAGAIGANPVDASMFAGLVALFAAPATAGAGRGTGRWIGLAAIVPAIAGVLLGVVLPRDPLWSIFALAAVAALAAWVRRFGPLAGGFGQLVFVAYYFTLLLGVDAPHLPGALAAVAVGIVCAWLSKLIPGPGPRRRLDGGLAALYERTRLSLDAMIDIVSTGRGDRRLVRTLRSQQRALERTAAALTAQLDDAGDDTSSARADALHTRVFDLQLANENLAGLLPVISSITITVDERSRLAAELAAVQRHLVSFRPGTPPEKAPAVPAPPSDWSRDARRVLAAIGEVSAAVDRLRSVQLADDGALAADAGVLADPRVLADTPRAPDASASDRRAVQAGVSTGLALFLGSLVSSSHQYWAAMPAFQVLSGSDGETRVKGFQRVIATILGSGVAFGIALLADHNPFVAFPLLFVSVFFMSFLRSVSSAWTAFWQTLLLATMYDVLGTLSAETVQVRLLETAIGALVAVAISAVILPTRTRTKVLRGMDDIVRGASQLAAAAFARASAPASVSFADLSGQERELGRRLGALERLAGPIRQDPGSLQRAGIEAQLAALWSLLGYGDRLARDVEKLSAAQRASVDWDAAASATAENFAGVLAVLDDRLPARIHPADEFDLEGDTSSPERRETLVLIQRVNQTLLALIDAVRPGTVEATADEATSSVPSAEPSVRGTA